MNRKDYLEACQKESAFPNSQIVLASGVKARPMAYQLSFNKEGNAIHTCVVRDLKSNCVMYSQLRDVSGDADG